MCPKGKGRNPDETSRWKRISAALNAAEGLASGKRGSSEIDRKRVLASLNAAELEVEALLRSGVLKESEAQRLKRDLTFVSEGVTGKASAGAPAAPAEAPDDRGAVRKFTASVESLERKVASGKIKPEMLVPHLRSMECDLADYDERLKLLPGEERAEARKLLDKARTRLTRLKAFLEKAG